MILSFPISVYEVAMHTEHYTQPRLQRHVIRILWMVRRCSLRPMGGGLYMYMAMNCTCMRHCSLCPIAGRDGYAPYKSIML